MTVSSSIADTRYAGDGSSVVFASGFPFYANSTLRVSTIVNATGVETVAVLNADYSVSGGNGASGSITFVAAPAAATTVVFKRMEPYTQETELGTNDPLPADVLELSYDKLEMQIQQIYARTITAIQAPALFNPSNTDPFTLPTPVDGQVLIGNGDNTGWDSASLSELASALDVAIVTPSNRDLLEYDTGGAVWRNQTFATVIGRLLTTRGDLAVRGASTVGRLAVGTNGQVLASNGTDPAWVTPLAWAGVRQTVAAGPVSTSTGLPNFLPSTNAALSVTSQNLSSSAPFVATAANGWSGTTGLPVDAVGFATANLTWSGLTASRAAATPNFLYVTIAGTTLTPASTILAPIYQFGGVPATTNHQITFNTAEMKAYLGNGVSAPQTNVVIVGEAATDGSTVISTVTYAYNGKYESAFTATLPSAATFTSANHNIGVVPNVVEFIAENTSTELGYAVGDRVKNLAGDNGSFNTDNQISVNAKAIGLQTSATAAFVIPTRTTGIIASLTLNKWQYKFVASRGW